MRRVTWLLALVLWLPGCALDEEAALRARLADWLFLADTRIFVSKSGCTVAVFDLVSTEVRSKGPVPERSFEAALRRIASGRAVLFDLPGQSPDIISREVMSRDLPMGIGLLSSGVGPARRCMDESLGRAFYRVLTAPQSRTVYDPESDALILLYPPENLAFFLRGTV